MEFGLAVVVLRALGTAVALQTARVGVLCGGHGVVSTRSGFLSTGVGVRWVIDSSLSNGVSVQSGRVLNMSGGLVRGPVQPWFYLHRRVASYFV